MGQAPPVDLSESQSKNSADDLLSQLAGEEVDKLLADADLPEAPADEKTAQVFGPDGEVRRAAPGGDGPAKASPENSASTDQTTIDEILAAAEASESPAADPRSPDSESPTTAAERSALDGVAQELEAQARADDQSPDPMEAPVPLRAPLFLKPLQLLNAPMAILPASVRDAIGKIAILTLFNSIAVILYVLLFRKH